MLKCREVVHQADALLAGELNRRQRFVMRVHLVICRHCRRYIRQFERLLRGIPSMHGPANESEIDTVLTAVERARQQSFE